jgi:hypothetical protein
MDQEQLRELRRKIMKQVLDQPELLVEFKELKEAISKLNSNFPGMETIQFLRDVLFSLQSKELKYSSDSKLNEKIQVLVDTVKELQIPRPEIVVNTPKEITIKNTKEISDGVKIPREMRITNLSEIKQREFPKKIEVSNFKEVVDKMIPAEEVPLHASMELDDNNLWKKVSIKYPNKLVNIKIGRNTRDVITELVFSTE